MDGTIDDVMGPLEYVEIVGDIGAADGVDHEIYDDCAAGIWFNDDDNDDDSGVVVVAGILHVFHALDVIGNCSDARGDATAGARDDGVTVDGAKANVAGE
jgi:hypothetical protein